VFIVPARTEIEPKVRVLVTKMLSGNKMLSLEFLMLLILLLVIKTINASSTSSMAATAALSDVSSSSAAAAGAGAKVNSKCQLITITAACPELKYNETTTSLTHNSVLDIGDANEMVSLIH